MINLTAVIDNDEAIKKLKEFQNVAKSTTSSVVKDSERIDDGFSKIENTLKGLVAGISMGALVRQLVQVRGEVQQLEVAFETMLGSKEKADKLVNEAVQLAAKTPFGLQDVSNGAKMLLAYGSAAEEVTEEIKMLGNIASGLSIPLNDLIYLYGTTRTQGRMFTQDLRQFMGRGIPLAEELAKQFGVTKDEVGALVTDGKVGFDEMAKALQNMTGEGGQFYNLMEKQSQTITGQISNLEDSIYQMFNAIGDNSEGIISGTIDVVASLVENYERVGRVLMGLVATYGVYKTAVIAASVAASKHTIAEVARVNVLIAVRKAQQLLNATMLKNPLVLAATAVAGLVTLLISQKNETERLREAEEEYNNAKQETINKEEEHKRAIESLLNVAGDEAASTDTRRAALNNLIMRYPEVFAKYDTEIAMLKDIKRIKLEIANIEAGKSITKPENELTGVRAEIAKWYEEEASYIERLDPMTGKKKKTLNVSPKQRAKIAALEKRAAELQKEIKENNRKTYLDNVGQLTAPQLTAEIERLNEAQQILTMYNAIKGQIGKNVESLGYANQLAKLGYGVNDAQKISGELTILNAEQNRRNAKQVTAGDWLKEKKEEWEKAEKTYNDFLKKKDTMSEEDFKKQSEELKEAADTAKKEYQKYAPTAGKKTSASDKQKEAAKKAFELSQKIQQEAQQSEIDLMKEGTSKKLAQIDADYEQQKAEIDKKEKELRALHGELTKEQIDNFSTLYDNLAKKRRQDRLDAAGQSWEDYHIQYGNEEERRAAINSKYDRLIRGTDDVYAQQMYEKQREEELNADIIALENYYIQLGTLAEKIRATKAKYERQIRDAKNDGERKALEAERDVAIAGFEAQASEWAKEITALSTNKLNKMLKEMQKELEAKEAAYAALDSSDSSEAEQYRKTINELRAKIEELQRQLGTAERRASDGNWSDAAQVFHDIASAANDVADGLEGVNDGLAYALKSFGQIAGAAGSLVSAIGMVVAASGTLNIALGVIGVIAAAINAVLSVINLAKDNYGVEETARQFKELNTELERTRELARIDSWKGTIFGEDPFGNFLNNIKVAQDALDDLGEAQEKLINRGKEQWGEVEVETGIKGSFDNYTITDRVVVDHKWDNVEESLANMQVKTRDRSAFAEMFGAKDEYANLGDMMPGLFGEDGKVTLDALQELKNSDVWEKLSQENRDLIDEMIADWELYEDATNAVETYLKDIFGDLGMTMTNALVDAFQNGTDAAEAFADAASDALERLTREMIHAAFIQPIIDEYIAQVEAMNKNKDLTAEERLALLTEMISNMQKDIMAQQGVVEEAYRQAEANAAESGYTYGDTNGQNATSKGFQTMSQETGSELNGRFTDIQGQAHRIAEVVEFCRGLQSQQLQQVRSINDTVAKIHNNVDLIATHTRELRQMREDLSSIKTAIYDGAI
ncbi:MAG: tape measure protein [Alistipes sp.]|nr:tape measure protein [Alistipes sp.]